MTNIALSTNNPQIIKRILHVQVTGEPTLDKLHSVAEGFGAAVRNGDQQMAVATGDDVQCYNILINASDPISFINVHGTIMIDTIAKVAHEVNQAYLKSLGQDVVSWEEATEEQRQSMIKGVVFKLRNPTSTPEQQHEAWLAAKTADGWTYGKLKDLETKTNPAMLPYDALPQEQRVKDFLFHGVVMSLSSKLPHPSPQVQDIEVWNAEDSTFSAGDFMKLTPTTVFRFKDQTQVYQATSTPFVNYMPDGKPGRAAWSIDVNQVEIINNEDNSEAESLTDVTLADEEDAAKIGDWVAEDGIIHSKPVDEDDYDVNDGEHLAEARLRLGED